MQNDRVAYISVQGNTADRRHNIPSGFVVLAPVGIKTFRSMNGATKWCAKNGYVPRANPLLRANRSAAATQDDVAEAVFTIEVEESYLTMSHQLAEEREAAAADAE